jgi:hypothetical protein
MYGVSNVSVTGPVSPSSVEKYDTQQMGMIFQNTNPNTIISISWDTNGRESGPSFYIFKDILEVANILKGQYQIPFVLANADTEEYTKGNALLFFNDNALELRIIAYKDEGYIYKFFRNDAYQYLKQALTQDSISYNTYMSSQY